MSVFFRTNALIKKIALNFRRNESYDHSPYINGYKFRQSKPPYSHFFWVMPAGFFVLGVWQVFRYFDKENYIERARQRMNSDPLPFVRLEKSEDNLENCVFHKVYLDGHFTDRTTLAGPCDTGRCGHDMVSMAGNFHLLQMFQLKDKTRIWVDRGVLPSKMNTKRGLIPDEYKALEAGKTRFHGYLMKAYLFPAGNKPYTNEHDYGGFYVHQCDDDFDPELSEDDAEDYDPLDKYTRLKNLTPDDLPITFKPNIKILNNHFEYLLTWYF